MAYVIAEPCIGTKDTACVAVCPTGIDIRDGNQLECINCALCIDACDSIMAKVDRAPRLIAYDTEMNIKRRMNGLVSLYRVMRWRTALYVAVIGIVGMGYDEGRAFIDGLNDRIIDVCRTYFHDWRPRDVMIWDNRCLLHYVVPDHPRDMHRLMHRTTASGDRPY